MSKATFILQNKFVDEITDEQFGAMVEAIYDALELITFNAFMGNLTGITVYLRVFIVDELQKKLCKHMKGKIADCRIVEKGKIQCDVDETYANRIPADKLIEKDIFIEYVKLVHDGKICNINLYDYANKLWDEYTSDFAYELNAYIERLKREEEEDE